MKQAFTLIELLVVVLIIGILASIALPQYQTAVNKSRYAGLMPLAQSVKQAEEEMLMSKGDYTADLRDLSIQVPGTISQSGNTATVGDGTTVEVFSNGTQDFVKVSRENLPNTYVMYFNKSGNFAGGIHCEAAKSGDTVDKRAKQLCESLGGQPLDGTGTSADYVTYVLEGPLTGTGSGAPTAQSGPCGSSGCFGDSPIPNNVVDVLLAACASSYGGPCATLEEDEVEYDEEDGVYYADPGKHGSFTYDPENHRAYLGEDGTTRYFDDNGNYLGYFYNDYDEERTYYDSTDTLVWRAELREDYESPGCSKSGCLHWECITGTCPDDWGESLDFYN